MFVVTAAGFAHSPKTSAGGTVGRDVSLATGSRTADMSGDVHVQGNGTVNAFTPSTTVRYDLPRDGDERIEVFNLLGQIVVTLVSGR